MMETPEKTKNNQITTSIENLQLSPVFDFLDNLSPIKPVKSTHFRESINPLSFASLSPVFASPHENPLKELKFLQRCHVTDQAKPEFAYYENTNAYAPKNFEQDKENLDPLSCGPTFDVSELLVSPANVGYDCNNPNPQKGFYRNFEADLEEGSSRTVENRWENYISGETDLFVLIESSCEEQVDPATTYYKNIKNAMKNMIMVSHGSTFSGEQALKRVENAEENLNTASGSSANNNPPIEKAGYEQHSGLSNDLSRHGFIYPSSNSPMLINSDNINLSKQHQSVLRNDSPHLILSEFGLQLNPLSRTLGTSFDQKSINTEKNQDSPKRDRRRSYKHMRRQENNTISPKKKRRKSESIESCKRCNCKKSKCLKLYCECFAAGVYCVEPCACIDCFNKPIHAETVITMRKQIEARNPLAFAPKVIKGDDSSFHSDTRENLSSTPASARHKRGCNCKKSGCFKKYCECYQSGVGCSINCRCENCKNAFGRKDSFAVAMEAELDEEEDGEEDSGGDQWKLRNNGFSSNQKPPRCSFPAIPHSSSLQHIPKFGRSFEDDSDRDEIPEILRFRQCSKSNKVLSPNGKRVSPPQTRQHLKMSSSSPGLRSSSRRLILTSIPSFPSLATYNQ